VALKAMLHRINRRVTRARLRRRGLVVGPDFKVTGLLPLVRNAGEIMVGKRVLVHGSRSPVRLNAASGTIVIGDDVFLNTGVIIYSAARVEIGKDTKIADDCVVSDTNFHAVHQGQSVRPRPIKIGRNVWLGRQAVVMPGVEIGDHSVIAAGSVVYDNVPAKQVWRGNPATFYKPVKAEDDFARE